MDADKHIDDTNTAEDPGDQSANIVAFPLKNLLHRAVYHHRNQTQQKPQIVAALGDTRQGDPHKIAN